MLIFWVKFLWGATSGRGLVGIGGINWQFQVKLMLHNWGQIEWVCGVQRWGTRIGEMGCCANSKYLVQVQNFLVPHFFASSSILFAKMFN